jgi:acetyl esterase/lipase
VQAELDVSAAEHSLILGSSTENVMKLADPLLVESAPLPYLLALPAAAPPPGEAAPVLCFLHGYDEGAPMPIHQALTRHGPLRASSAPLARERFIVMAPQLPVRGDPWHRHADAVLQIVRQVQSLHGGDPERTCLTGFSFGGNGVFDLALAQRDAWAALWAVDPTRVPLRDPGLPVWLSAGEITRYQADGFVRRLESWPPMGEEPGDRVYLDEGADHVGSATLAYADERIYHWLLARRRAS